jgi:hypothetical protein
MQEQESQVVTAKADLASEDAPQSSRKGWRGLWIVLGILGLCLACVFGAVVGGGLMYGLSRAHGGPIVRTWSFRVPPFAPLPRELPLQPDEELEGPFMGLAEGALIVELVPDGPADKAGLEAGDLLVAVDGTTLGPDSDLATTIAAYDPGDRITLEVASGRGRLWRSSREVSVTLWEHPDVAGKAYLGVTFVQIPGSDLAPGDRFFRFYHFDDDSRPKRLLPEFERPFRNP